MVKRIIVLSILFSLAFIHCGAQCLLGGLIIYDQTQIDNFSSDFPGCTKILGSIQFNEPSILDFSGLSQIDSIMGNFYANEDGGLSSFFGFENLVYIGGNLEMDEAETPTNFQGLNNLVEIGGNLDLEEFNMVDFSGLESLSRIGGSILLDECYAFEHLSSISNIDSIHGDVVIECEELASLSGFENLKHIGGNFQILDSDSLTSVESLANLNSVNGDLFFDCLSALEDVSGLENLSVVGGDLYFRKLNSLENLNGLNGLNEIYGQLRLWENSLLTSLEGLEALDESTLGGLELWLNYQLSFCSLENICTYINDDLGPSIVEDNSLGCLSEEQILDNCVISSVSENITSPLVVFPNPSNGHFFILNSEKRSFGVYDAGGRFLQKAKVNMDQIDLSDLSPGVYVLRTIGMNPLRVLIK